jgi:hypothetical protein
MGPPSVFRRLHHAFNFSVKASVNQGHYTFYCDMLLDFNLNVLLAKSEVSPSILWGGLRSSRELFKILYSYMVFASQ